MGEATILVGTGIISALLLWLTLALDKEYWLYKLIVFTFFLSSLLIIGQTVNNGSDYCEWTVVNSTTSGSTTTYEHDYLCENNNNTTNNTLYQLITWFITITWIVVFFFFLFYKYFVKESQKIIGGKDDER